MGRKELRERQGMKNQDSKRSQNKEFARVTYFFVILFLALMAYIVYFNIVKAKAIVNSPYNERQENFAQNVVRGTITDKNGYVLAETDFTEDGVEYRYYPYGSLFSHAVGYSSQNYGNTGLESIENFDLLTSNAFFVEKIKNDFQEKKNTGDIVITTFDVDLQQACANAMGDNKGAVIVMEPSTGKILAVYSNPGFDPNQIGNEWEYLNQDEDNSPLLNRVTQGLYAPGSTFKVVTALEYLKEHPDNYTDYSYECYGEITKGDTTIHCFDDTAHGWEDLRSSMANSCNSSFANIGLSLDKSAYRKTAEQLLFNKALPCEYEYSKSSFALNQNTSNAEVMMTAMGQGNTIVSPYHMALITSAIANGGTLMEPYAVEKVTNYTGNEIKKNVPKSYKKLMASNEASQLKEYMRAVVEEGTGIILNNSDYSVAGKTGTAEYSMDDGEKTHSWFVGFTNYDNPELVISIIVEGYDGNDGAKSVPMAKQILDSYYYR